MIKTSISFFFKLISNSRKFYGLLYFINLKSLQGLQHGAKYESIKSSGEFNVLKLIKKHNTTPLIIDGGANVGQYAKSCAEIIKSSGEVICFEPSYKTYCELIKNIDGANNFILENYALSDGNKELTLHSDKDLSQMASIVDLDLKYINHSFTKTEKINAVSLDSYCKTNKISKISLLKLDIEGYELIALKGCKTLLENKQIDAIQFEFGKQNIDSHTFFKDFYQLLHEDFKLYRIVSYGLMPIASYSHELEVFYGSNYLAINKLRQDIINEI